MTIPPETQPKEKASLTDFLRKIFKKTIDGICRWLDHLGVKPIFVTTMGLILNLVAGILIAFGNLTWGGIVALIAGPLDALDGSLARLRGDSTRYGAFIDSVVDRYSELFLLAGLLMHFSRIQDWMGIWLTFFTAAGSVLVSYVRARAEGVGYSAKVGLLTRVERYLILVPGIIFHVPVISLWIMAIFSNFTAVQRIYYVRKQAVEQMEIGKRKKKE